MPLLSVVRRHSILSRLTNTEGYPGPGCAWAELSTRTRLCTVCTAESSASTYFCPRLYLLGEGDLPLILLFPGRHSRLADVRRKQSQSWIHGCCSDVSECVCG